MQITHNTPSSLPWKEMVMTRSIFALIDELQQIHGLRVDDFVRYRRYCSRKLERLRSKFNLKHTKTSKVIISQEMIKANPEVLHLILFKCEWFSAQINQLRNESTNSSRKKHHLRSICLNSMKYIDELLSKSQDQVIDEEIRLEYLAYCNLFKGIVKNELKEFSTAHNSLEKSKIIIEKLIKMQNENEIYERKLNEIETIMRVCQYSADMYDIVIEIDDLNDFKLDQLTEDLKKSEIKDQILMKFGSKTFKLAPIILIDDLTYKNVQLSRKLLQNSNEHLLQVAYFENRLLRKIIKRQLRKGIIDSENLLKIISRLKGYEADENYSKSIDLLCNLLKSVKDCDHIGTLSAFKLIKDSETVFKENNFKFKFLTLVLKHQKLIMKNLPHVKCAEIPKDFISAALVPPKPSFYDMAFDCLSPTIGDEKEEIEIISDSKVSTGSGLSKLLSSFWGNRK